MWRHGKRDGSLQEFRQEEVIETKAFLEPVRNLLLLPLPHWLCEGLLVSVG